MPENPTHRLVKSPKVNGRYLADYMDASERTKRTIIRGCKFPPIAKLLQHQHAKGFIANFLRNGSDAPDPLHEEAERLREMMADTDFDRNLFDLNADVLDAYAEVFDPEKFPKAEIAPMPDPFTLDMAGVEVKPDLRLALQRTTKTNRLRTGFLSIRYAKGKPLSEDVGKWQSSLLFACRKMLDGDDQKAAEHKLCVTLDAATGEFIEAPGDAVSRFANMEAACQSIAERWDSIEPPPNAIVKE
ncbi:hypothetical protein [Pacificimonas flava]|nr:hypothetical protein [Pacificimonas flava]MBB5280227.1 hypothetical protein [Pacificimonas flava]